MDELKSAEVLNEALDALREGARYEDVAAALPEDVRCMLDAAERLAGAGHRPARVGPGLHQGGGRGQGQAQGPSATFTLGLEEQLRTDLRLRAGELTGGFRAGWRGVVLVAGLLAIGGTLALVGTGYGPFGARPADGASLTAEEALARLDDGWRQVEALRAALDAGDVDGAALRGRLDRITAAFLEALDSTADSGNARAEARIRADVATAAGALAAMARSADGRTSEEIVASQRQLVVRLLRSRVGSLDPDPVEVPGTIAVTRTIVSTPLASPTSRAEPTPVPGEPTADPAPSSPTAPPIASPTPTALPPFETALPSPTATLAPIEPAPPATSRPRPTDPSPPAPTEAPAPIVPPTRTPDAWPTAEPTDAPLPPPVAPSPGAEPSAPPPAPSPPSPSPAPRDPSGAGNATRRP